MIGGGTVVIAVGEEGGGGGGGEGGASEIAAGTVTVAHAFVLILGKILGKTTVVISGKM